MKLRGLTGLSPFESAWKAILSPVTPRVKVYLVGFPAFVKKCTVDGTEIPIREIRIRERSLYTLDVSTSFERIDWES
jgi:hypothetical protein